MEKAGSMCELGNGASSGTTQFEAALEQISTLTQTLAQQQQGHSLELLAILRVLEGLHQEIRDSFFQESLPDNRQALYALLRDIELSGGWPYIHRMKLQALLVNLLSESELAELAVPAGSAPATADPAHEPNSAESRPPKGYDSL